MISGWAGTGLIDSAILMPSPETSLRLHAGGYPLVRTLSLIVPFPTREIEDRQIIQDRQGVDARDEYGWQIEFFRNDAYGAAICELNTGDFPLLIETCPHVMVDSPEEADVLVGTTREELHSVISYTAEPECVGIVVVEE
jgi:hypothetical protein